ncbi:hypothetical protein A2210_02885 [Candidatus Woesebacteria bacterium RIFOXYA1_FULL_40_18]|uniref:Uncharacterized protein n=3 Tax=Candidatus Woeseibacteriota TaxID=1752722 RepID=A0A1F8CIN6_9BACT|nr:MAG: hypothetical protein A2210_02885 [Candidatus Woesebacteria bacterium RIFOXYA1_FULL_40_18]OGM80305.1 MAG: hypothetical protein A2361_01750 [Candidatus Woesebacteria bacterium RIFOXYB1_FULL_40_26]OGM87170.1 MAG: hypothetical protein A2614_01865 [Candidatus Woesebacteria bacterium RIFOXYD1_FULL_40_21]
MRKTYFISKILDRFHRGWLTSFSLAGQRTELPYSTKVVLIKNLKDGQLIRVEENNIRGEIVKIPFLFSNFGQHQSYLSKNKINYSKLRLKLRKKDGLLLLGDKKYRCVVDENITNGDYLIKFPLPKLNLDPKLTNETSGGSRFANTWFPITRRDDRSMGRFLHFGSFSKGCITVRFDEDMNSIWSEIYLKIILARMNNNTLASLRVS